MKNFQEEIKTLPAGAKLGWNSEVNQFHVVYNGLPLYSFDKQSVNEAVRAAKGNYGDVNKLQTLGRTMRDLNDGIESMVNIAQDQIKEPAAYAIKLLLSNEVDLKNVQGLPASILEAIRANQAKLEREKKAKETYEGRGK
jgi:hypothetical protein